jgi:SAM-dependent methyltransferase
MKKRLRNITQADFDRYMGFAARHPNITSRDHVLQKLTIFNFVTPFLARYRPQHILEIGCGLGFHAALLTTYGKVWATELEVPGSFVTMDGDVGKDRDIVLAELARNKVEFRANDGRKFPFPDESFDAIFHNSVIEHVPDATVFNRETARMLKPSGVAICITGTPALCRFRFLRNHVLRLPLILAAALVKEVGLTSRQTISAKIKALLPQGARRPAYVPGISGWNARLAHYANSPLYNELVLDELAREAGLERDAALGAAYEHLRASFFNRLRFYLTPQTHGQHYRDFRHEMLEYKLERWHAVFASAGFDVVEIVPYRFHHLLEPSFSGKFNSALYHWAAPLIERFQRAIPLSLCSEFILVARKR